MKWIAAILAAGFFAGCGVGADDPEGLIASGNDFGSSQQAITAAGDGIVGGVDGGTGPLVGVATSFAGAGPVSAPQDPIPPADSRMAPLPLAPIQPGSPRVAPVGADPRPVR